MCELSACLGFRFRAYGFRPVRHFGVFFWGGSDGPWDAPWSRAFASQSLENGMLLGLRSGPLGEGSGFSNFGDVGSGLGFRDGWYGTIGNVGA